MKDKILRYGVHLSIFACAGICPLQAQDAEEDEEVYELSPFTISEDEAVGYQATTTLAGTRLKTDLRDLGSAISVFTEDVFKDTGAVDAETILSYGLNTEVGGVHGNFAGGLGTNHNSRAEQDIQRTNPQFTQRIRGLAEASLTRDYFLTDIPFDSYNSNRVDISRGANSLLFGVGAPGGIINNTTHLASADGRDFGEVSIRIGERNSHRETVDVHQVLFKDRLAVRISGLYDDTIYQQRPAYEIDKRLHVALEAILFKNDGVDWLGRTKLRANGEGGSIMGNPPNIIPPTDGITDWFQPPDIAALQQVPGVVVPGYYTGNTPPGRSHPQFGITEWQPKLIFDNRLGLTRGNTPNVAEVPGQWQLLLVYPGVNGPPSIPMHTSQTAQGLSTTADHFGTFFGDPYVGLDSGIRGQFNLLGTGSFFMGNRNGQAIPNFVTPVIMDPRLWDNENEMIQGSTNWRNMSFDTYNFTLEQPLFDNRGGLEVSFDHQNYRQSVNIPYTWEESVGDTGNNDVVIDIGLYLTDGTPNPNVGRPMMKQDEIPSVMSRKTKRDAFRATGFYEVDFRDMTDNLGWLGRHTFTAFYNEQKIDTTHLRTDGQVSSDSIDLADTTWGFPWGRIPLRGFFRKTVTAVYLGPSALDASAPHEVELNRINVDLPEDGDTFEMVLFNNDTRSFENHPIQYQSVLVGGNRRKQVLDTQVLSWQGRFWNDNIVALYGWRKDETVTFENITADNSLGIPRLLDTSESNIDFIRLQDMASNPAEGQTQTASLVAHIPDDWMENMPVRISLHVSESENFQPSGTRRDIRGNVLAPPNGTTEEYGFTLSSADNRWSARFNWFETRSAGSSVSVGEADTGIQWITNWMNNWDAQNNEGLTVADNLVKVGADPNLFSSFEEAQDVIFSFYPSDIAGLRNPRYDDTAGNWILDPNPGETSTRDFISEGLELDLVANITNNWRFMINIGQQESVQSNTAVPLREVQAEIRSRIEASPLSNIGDWPQFSGPDPSFLSRWNALITQPLGAVAAKDNAIAFELREWRYNALTNYEFTEGALRGTNIGGAVRHQSKSALGAPNLFGPDGGVIPDVANPFWGPSEWNGDIWVGYTRPILNGKVNWNIQLNIRSAFGDDDPIPVVVNPDGKVAVVRNSNPQELFLTNTISF